MKTTKSIEMELVMAGRKGVTNKQMLEAFKSNLNEEQLLQLLTDYPMVFLGSIKYTPDAKKLELQDFVQKNGYPNFEVKTGKKIRSQELKTKEDNIITLESYKNKNNAKLAEVAKNIKVLSEEEQAMVKEMVEKDLGISELAKLYNLTKDQAYNKIFRSKYSIYNKLKAN